MTLSLAQKELEKNKWMKWFHIWERDLLECARRWEPWRRKAHELGFRDEKIDALWTFPDAGRLIQYMENPFYGRDTIQVSEQPRSKIEYEHTD